MPATSTIVGIRKQYKKKQIPMESSDTQSIHIITGYFENAFTFIAFNSHVIRNESIQQEFKSRDVYLHEFLTKKFNQAKTVVCSTKCRNEILSRFYEFFTRAHTYYLKTVCSHKNIIRGELYKKGRRHFTVPLYR